MTEAHERSTMDLQIEMSKKWIQKLPQVEYYDIERITVVTDIFTGEVFNEYNLKTQIERNLRRVESFYEQCDQACKWVEKVIQNIQKDYDSACKEYQDCRAQLVEERRKIMEQVMTKRGELEAAPAATAEYLPYKSIYPHETEKSEAYAPKIE
jgi:hypothetical protein